MTSQQPSYRTKITQQVIDEAPPEKAMPSKLATSDWQHLDVRQGVRWGKWSMLFGVGFIALYAVFSAITGLVDQYAAYPISTLTIATVLAGFLISLLALIVREWRGIQQVRQFMAPSQNIHELAYDTDKQEVLSVIDARASRFASGSYAALCYREFKDALTSDMSSGEVIGLYQRNVQQAVELKANEVLKKESVIAGSMSFISPNPVIQTLALLWISLRTIKRIALVFGLYPASLGNWRLLQIVAQNLAAQSVLDLATDEITNQISGSLSAKLIENSAEAIAAGALNVRLGKALVKMLK